MLDDLAGNRINIKLIVENWDDLLRLAGSLKLGVVRASGLTRVLQTNDRPTRLARALQELGRLIKTLDPTSNVPSFMSRVRSPYASGWGELQRLMG